MEAGRRALSARAYHPRRERRGDFPKSWYTTAGHPLPGLWGTRYAKSPGSRRLARIGNRQWNEQRHSEPFGSEAESPRASRALASITMGDDEHRKVDWNDYAYSKA